MEKRDYLMHQIEQMGKVLAQVVATFLRLKSKGKVDEGIHICNEQLQNELDIDMESLARLDKIALKDFFADRKFTPAHLETLSNYMEEVGKSLDVQEPKRGIRFLKKAIQILELADEMTGTFSFERMQRIESLNKELAERH